MNSKEEEVLWSFFSTPKHWRFKELLTNISRVQLTSWLKKFENEELITRVKPPGKMPYYIPNENHAYQTKKRLAALKQLSNSGLFEHLTQLTTAKTIILFGSYSRADWYKESDLDIFIYGKDDDFEQGYFEKKLKRNIQVHKAENKEALKKMEKLLPYILTGYHLKGNIEELPVEVHVKN